MDDEQPFDTLEVPLHKVNEQHNLELLSAKNYHITPHIEDTIFTNGPINRRINNRKS